mgnify:CR=1 FL=1
MNIDKTKYNVHRHFRLVYGVTLSQAQLDDINDFYHEARKASLKDVIYYRFVNMMIFVIFLVSFLLMCKSIRDAWFELLFLVALVVYNLIHGLINWIQYKRIKQPIRPSDEG